MTRRDLARLSAAAAGLAAQRKGKAQAAKYTSALNGFESKVDMGSFDPIAFTLRLHDAAPMKMAFRATSRKEAEAWQKQLRPKLVELMGGFPEKKTPLDSQTLEVREFPNYRREKFVIQAR